MGLALPLPMAEARRRMNVTRLSSFCLPLVLAACGSSAATPGGGADAHGSPDSSVPADGGSDATFHVGSDASGSGTDAHGGMDVMRARDARGPQDAKSAMDAKSAADAHRADAATCSGGCPPEYTCGTANGIPVCRAPSGVPLFSHVFLIMEENTSLSNLLASINANAAPNFASLLAKYASGTEYHGVSHPSLPNYVALTSGSTQGITCDCQAQPGQGTCGVTSCEALLGLGSCTCTQSVMNLADQIETANKTWTAFGESMGTACNVVNAGNYAVRHVPFLYYDDIQTNTARCNSHVVDYSQFAPASPPDFTYIAPNLIDDMHNPVPATQGNITNGDKWIGPVVETITGSAAYKDGGLFVIVWDEDQDSGGATQSTDDPVPIFVLSPYAKSGGYMAPATMDHYSLLATIEDGLGLPRMGNAGVPRASTADTLAEYFPDQ